MPSPQETYASKKISLNDLLALLRPKETLATSIAAGQPQALLNHLSNKPDIEDWQLFTGLCAFPYPILGHPKVHVTSGYYGPVERMANEAGFNMAYLPLAFNAFEIYAEKFNPRVVMTTLSPMDEHGLLSFGVDCEAIYDPFLKAARDPNRLAIAQVNPRMPVVRGLAEWGNNAISIQDIDYVVEVESPLLELPAPDLSDVEKSIAAHVTALIQTGDTLQVGIGGIPNEVARLLAQGDRGHFGIHSELISDGLITLMEAGKISGTIVFTFALGSQKLYDWLDERNGKNGGRAVAAPVSYVNDPTIIAKNLNMVSINAGFMIDFSGQVCSEAIGERQYSGVGGQLNFAQGAFHSPGGRGILCIKSSVMINGKRRSNIVDTLPPGSLISTPRHYVQYVVTEYGSVNLFGLTDEQRPFALIPLAHPDFRDELRAQAEARDRLYYKSRH